MKRMMGIAASEGIAIGKLALRACAEEQISKTAVFDVEAEIERVDRARARAEAELNQIYQDSLEHVGEQESLIFKIHIMMLRDEDFFGAVYDGIRTERANAEYAVWQATLQFSQMFAEMEDEYMRGRAADITDIGKRLLRCLNPALKEEEPTLQRKAIVAAVDFMPSETIRLDKGKVLAFVTRKGSRTSHSAILARTMGIPAVAALGFAYTQLKDGALTIVDGFTGEVIQEPDGDTLRYYEEKRESLLRHRRDLLCLKGTRAVTKSGRSVTVSANINSPDDMPLVLENDAESVGLFRSEFLYMNSTKPPAEEAQFAAYRQVLEQMQGRRVIIRTLDLGADKRVSYLNLPREDNPAMGCRAIRLCLEREEMFLTQLRALLRASAYGRLSILLPMITSVEEVRRVKSLLERTRGELREKGIPFSQKVELGIMVETPAAVAISPELARETDFFSLGTNDLTQYVLAVDRMNPQISNMYDPRHPAVLRMVEAAVQNAKKAGIWVGVCGESAADPALLGFYLGIGVDELSVAPSSVLELRRAVQQMD